MVRAAAARTSGPSSVPARARPGRPHHMLRPRAPAALAFARRGRKTYGRFPGLQHVPVRPPACAVPAAARPPPRGRGVRPSRLRRAGRGGSPRSAARAVRGSAAARPRRGCGSGPAARRRRCGSPRSPMSSTGCRGSPRLSSGGGYRPRADILLVAAGSRHRCLVWGPCVVPALPIGERR